jgi:hypothetical protein
VVTLINNWHHIIWRSVSLPPSTQKLVLEGLSLMRGITSLPLSITELVLISCRLTPHSFERLNLPNLRILRIEGYAPTPDDLQACHRLVQRCRTVEDVWVSGARVRIDDVVRKLCREPRCTRRPSHGLQGQRIYCARHAGPMMQDLGLTSRRYCGVLGCRTQPSYGLIGSDQPTHCASHADRERMENVRQFDLA